MSRTGRRHAPRVRHRPRRAAADLATEAARATADLRPKVGRARPLAERSVGTPDAGATSPAMCARTVADCFTLTAKGDN